MELKPHPLAAHGRHGDAGVSGGPEPVLAGAVVRDGVPAELTAADLDAIAHGPRGYPKLTPEQLAEVLRKDEDRWQRSRGLVQRPGRIDWGRTRYFRR